MTLISCKGKDRIPSSHLNVHPLKYLSYCTSDFSLTDPNYWSVEHTNHWLTWAANEFGMKPSPDTLEFFRVPGKQLCGLSKEEFTQRLPKNIGELFWTHLQVLMKSRFSKLEPVLFSFLPSEDSQVFTKLRSCNCFPTSNLLLSLYQFIVTQVWKCVRGRFKSIQKVNPAGTILNEGWRM